jgi:hypothetical protein
VHGSVLTIPKPLVQICFLLGLIALAVGLYLRQLLPDYHSVLPSTLDEPLQTRTLQPPFKVSEKGVEYTIKPVADYEITGVVVSQHDTAVFWDYIHAEYNDHINVADLCIVWGNNLKSNNYQALRYSSGQFTCNVATDRDEVWTKFDPDALSNNHLLTSDRSLAKRIRNVKVGDQVRLKGHLASYSHNSGNAFERGTSTVRTDRGNGACETIFVTQAEVLKPTSGMPGRLRAAGWILLALSSIAWVFFTGYGRD